MFHQGNSKRLVGDFYSNSECLLNARDRMCPLFNICLRLKSQSSLDPIEATKAHREVRVDG